jgi:hypothetical protein
MERVSGLVSRPSGAWTRNPGRSLDHDVGALALRKDGGLVLANDDGFYFYDFETEKLDLITLVDQNEPRSRPLSARSGFKRQQGR